MEKNKIFMFFIKLSKYKIAKDLNYIFIIIILYSQLAHIRVALLS